MLETELLKIRWIKYTGPL